MARKPPPIRSGDVIDLDVERLVHGGRGIARHDGFVVFVARGLPGDRVRARVGRVRRSHGEAIVEEVLTPSADRREAPCQYHSTCGGCQWQAFDYAAQLAAKQEQVEEAVRRLGEEPDAEILPIIGAEQQFGYRNKVEYTFTADEDGTVAAGFHRLGRWDELVGVDQCLIADERGRAAQRIAVEWANAHGLTVHDRETGEGHLRNLVVRIGQATGEIMVTLVTGPGDIPRLAEFADDIDAGVPGVVSVLHAATSSTADVAVGDGPPVVLSGRDWFEEKLAGVTLRVRPMSFLQTNTAMAERLYALVAERCALTGDETVWDLYSGIGSISLALAPRAREVLGIEVVEEAVHCAIENAGANGISNARFIAGNARAVLRLQKDSLPDPDVIVVDPPRSGLAPKVVLRICDRSPKKIIYVSCNPTTFAGNLPQFREAGYRPVSIQPVDLFPHTPHVELVATLEPIAAT